MLPSKVVDCLLRLGHMFKLSLLSVILVQMQLWLATKRSELGYFLLYSKNLLIMGCSKSLRVLEDSIPANHPIWSCTEPELSAEPGLGHCSLSKHCNRINEYLGKAMLPLLIRVLNQLQEDFCKTSLRESPSTMQTFWWYWTRIQKSVAYNHGKMIKKNITQL